MQDLEFIFFLIKLFGDADVGHIVQVSKAQQIELGLIQLFPSLNFFEPENPINITCLFMLPVSLVLRTS